MGGCIRRLPRRRATERVGRPATYVMPKPREPQDQTGHHDAEDDRHLDHQAGVRVCASVVVEHADKEGEAPTEDGERYREVPGQPASELASTTQAVTRVRSSRLSTTVTPVQRRTIASDVWRQRVSMSCHAVDCTPMPLHPHRAKPLLTPASAAGDQPRRRARAYGTDVLNIGRAASVR
jgi:hypothetical protein